MPFLDFLSVFFFNDTATTQIYTLSLHDALPILKDLDFASIGAAGAAAEQLQGFSWLRDLAAAAAREKGARLAEAIVGRDRKSTRLNSSHPSISYAVFCLKKKTYSHTLSFPTKST